MKVLFPRDFCVFLKKTGMKKGEYEIESNDTVSSLIGGTKL